MIEFGVLLLLGMAVLAACAVAVVIKALLWLLLLPFRILFWTIAGILSLPLLLVSALAAVVVVLLSLPLLLGAVAGALLLALLVPILPVLLLIAVIWALCDTSSGAVTKAG